MVQAFTPQAIERLEVAVGARKLGEIFLDLGYITEERLDAALDYQRMKGGRLGWIMATMGYINRLQLFEGLARHLSLPFLSDTEYIKKTLDRKTAFRLAYGEMIRHQVLPFTCKDDTLTVLTSDPDKQSAIEFLRAKFKEKKINQIVVTDLDIMRLTEELYRESILDASINGLQNRNPEESARAVFTKEQIAFLAGFFCTYGLWIYYDTRAAIIFTLFTVQLFYAVPIVFKLIMVVYGKLKSPALTMTTAGKPYDERNMPVFTILIAAYKEKEVIGNLIRSVKKMDYPENKLDIILLLEENDSETLQAAKAEKPPANWRFLVLPESLPRTKPKALNYGLNFARGEYLAIYDAEDIPEPDQLKKAVTAFKTHPDNYICFQAALNYFNKNENFLTKMFTLEYSGWFDCLLPGLFRARLPIPLGGTSNHFDVAKLRKIGAWDPYNVTEDADLGIRASMQGYKAGIIDSTTYEEATPQFGNWMRQRSRRVKGYMQTFLVHSRHPLKSLKVIGLPRWLSYTFLIGGTPLNFLLNPVMWLLFGAALFADTTGLFNVPAALLYIAGINLIAGNIIVTAIAMIGAMTRKFYNLIPYALLSPVYWMLQSFAAYKGAWQLITKPHYWEKTMHGLTKNIPVSQTLAIPEDISELIVVKTGKNA